MVKQSWSIYRRDLKVIFTNYAVLITIVALCILPSLYAWINIKASWDPYSSEATSRIKVAVVNNDAGTTLLTTEMNAGQEVVEGLKSNNLLGWCFLDEAQAMEDLEEGKVYAVIIIPNDFSNDLASIITNQVTKAEIKYIINEKLNAIAPKITVKGADGIQQTVSEEVTSTISNVVLSRAKALGIEIEDVVLPKLIETQGDLDKVEGKFGEINTFIDDTQDGVEQYETFINQVIDYMPQVETLITNSQNLIASLQEFSGNAEEGTNTLAPTIKKDIGLIKEVSGEIYDGIESLQAFIASQSEKVPEIVDNLSTKVDGLDQLINSMVKILEAINQLIPNQEGLENTLTNLQSIQTSTQNVKETLQNVENGLAYEGQDSPSILEDTKTVLGDIQSVASGLYAHFDSDILGKMNDIFGQVDVVLNDSSKTLTDMQQSLPGIQNLLDTAVDMMKKGDSGLDEIKKIMPLVEDKITELGDKLGQINENKQLKDLLKLLKEDVVQRAQFLANSTSIVQETIFPMGNYGTQMTPFYSTLASWVGLTILVSMISVEAKGEYKSHEVYFGKLLTYLTIALIQSLIIGLGDLYLLKIYCLRPWLFMISMLYISIVFTVIVYSLVSVFGNIGKVVAIILMILQVASSGGTFPVQLTSKFFISVNPYLPFTYAISLLREGIGGIAQQVFVQDLFVLGTFIVIFLILALLLKKTMNRVLGRFTSKYHEGDL